MRVVRFDTREVSMLSVGDEQLFLLSLGSEGTYLVNGACPHRGGPLHLGRVDEKAKFIHCPWHDRKTPVRHLRTNAVPLVIRDGAATAILSGPADAPIRLRRCSVLASHPSQTATSDASCHLAAE